VGGLIGSKIMKSWCIITLTVLQVCLAADEPHAELRLVRDSHTNETFLLAEISVGHEADFRIQGIKLFDPVSNIDVTRVSDGKELDNYSGGFAHAPYMQEFVIPKGVDNVSLRIPFPRSEALMRETRSPGEYLFKLRYFAGKPLRIRILEDGSLIPSKQPASKKDTTTGAKKDTMTAEYLSADSFPTHGVTMAGALKALGISYEKIDHLKLVGDESSGTIGLSREIKIDDWFWDRYFETAEPYKYWVPSGNRRLEVHLKGETKPKTTIYINETDRCSADGDPRKLTYMCHGLHRWFMANIKPETKKE
jgi:hypothetical protein